jgi:hypothetical protein
MTRIRVRWGAFVLVENGLAATLPRPLGAAPVPATRRVPATTLIAAADRRPAPFPAGVWTATGLERQVFLARSGRRSRGFGALSTLLAVLAVVWLTALMTGSMGFSNLPALPSAAAIVAPSTPAAHHAHVADRETRVAVRPARRRSFKVAAIEPATPVKRLAGGAFGRLGGQIHLG